jgi:hypothetical protein
VAGRSGSSTGPLAERSRRQALGILSGLFNYLVAAGFLAGNPLALRPGASSAIWGNRTFCAISGGFSERRLGNQSLANSPIARTR